MRKTSAKHVDVYVSFHVQDRLRTTLWEAQCPIKGQKHARQKWYYEQKNRCSELEAW